MLAQCGGKKNGIAIIRTEDGKPETPKAATQFPRYKGGTKAMCKYLCDNMKYPENLKAQKISGVTTVSFTVTSSGAITNVEVVNSSGQEAFDKEAVRLVESFPAWEPTKVNCDEMIDMNSQLDVIFDCEKCGCGKKE